MKKLSPVAFRAVLIGIMFAIAIVAVWYFVLRPSDRLPVYNPADIDQRLVDPAVRGALGEHHISDFSLTDQLGRTVTLETVRGKVVLADFFFTTCATICPRMSSQMARVQEAFRGDTRLMILSHSVTPEMDSVPVLKEYGERYDADPEHWRFLTGDRPQIYRLARRSYFAALDEGDGGPDDFVHTENFVLVDVQGRLRGFYDGTSEEDVDRAIADIGKLLDED